MVSYLPLPSPESPASSFTSAKKRFFRSVLIRQSTSGL